VSGIIGVWIKDPGYGYTSAPTLTATGGSGFVGTVGISPTTGTYPAAAGLFQQRQMYGATNNHPNTIWGSRSGSTRDFRVSNPPVASDALEFTIASQQVTTILWFQSMPGGLVIGTNSGVLQLTGGSASAVNPTAVTPMSAVIVPQAYFGSANVDPIVINYDILYVQSEGSTVRDLQYNFFVNIYTGVDLTLTASHLFYPRKVVDWAYQDSPNKVVWAIRDDGILLSLTYLKEQEVTGWARHDSPGRRYESIAVVQEGETDAVYVSMLHGPTATRSIERFVDQTYLTVEDAWCVDSGLSTVPVFFNATITLSATTGTVTVTCDTAIFNAGAVGGVIRMNLYTYTGKLTITAFIDTTHVTAVVDPKYPFPTVGSFGPNQWRYAQTVSTVSGLGHLEGQSVITLVDGFPQGPFTVSGGSIMLTTPGSQIVVGLPFVAQVQPLYADVGGEQRTIQGTRKKVAAVTIRVKDTVGIEFGTDFDQLREFVQGTSGTDPIDAAIPPAPLGLTTGDVRMIINQQFNRVGSVAIRQALPWPCTVLGVIPEITAGDAR
jgi:hypothetical protein